MAARLEELEATYLGIRHRFDACIVGTVMIPANGSPARSMVIKGDADEGELTSGQRYRFYGRFTSYRNKRSRKDEQQFHFHTFCQAVAHDRESVIAYLAGLGAGLGVGPGVASKAFDRWGQVCIATIRLEPHLLREISGRITPEQCEALAEKLRAQQATEDATIDLTSLLNGRGLPKATPRSAIKTWGNRAAGIVRRDPYKLIRFRGCGFKLTDALFVELGHNPARLRRQALCGWHSIASQSTGDTWFPASQVVRSIEGAIGGANANPKTAIRMGLKLGRMFPGHYAALAGVKTDGVAGPISENGAIAWLAESRAARDEQTLAEMIAKAIQETKPTTMLEFEDRPVTWTEAATRIQCRRCSRLLTAPEVHIWNGQPFGPTCIGYISTGEGVEVVSLADWIDSQPLMVQSAMTTIPRGRIDLPPFSLWPEPDKIIGVDDHQRTKLAEALISRVAILGGSPGTGKTYSVAMLIRALLAGGRVGEQDIAIGAPTGKAAVRLTEALEAAGVPLRARTWHSLLGVGASDDGDGWSFQHHAGNPWKFRVLIGDETSMVDTSLMRAIFAARPRGCHVLLVGDVNQLPPVGQGAPLRDLIASHVCGYGELTEIKRNSGGIVEACAAIRDGRRWEEGDNLMLMESSAAGTSIDLIRWLLTEATTNGLDPVWDCQVLCAVNEKSELSRAKLNAALQDQLNDNPPIHGTPFRLGDKIVCGKNGKYPPAEKPDGDGMADVYVANGELAKVVDVEPGRFIVELAISRELIVVPRIKPTDGQDAGSGCNWDLAYAISGHKSQGSEWPVVIVVLDDYPGARRVCSREWAYTGISRARQMCYLVGMRHVLDAMCRNQAINKRKTLLRERLQLEMAKADMEGMF
jgi:hypothetical protein